MKFIQKYILTVVVITGLFWFSSCADDSLELKIPYPNDITFNELALGRFTYEIPTAPFTAGDAKSGIVTMNVVNKGGGKYSGFALSNKNWRSYPWNLSPDFAPAGLTSAQKQQSIDSTAFSVMTNRNSRTENFVVGHAAENDAFFTLNTPAIVEHVLLANTTYTYLLAVYGSAYSGTFNSDTQRYDLNGKKVRNYKNPNPAADRYGRFTLPAPNNVDAYRINGHVEMDKRAAGHAAAEATRNSGGTEIKAISDSIAAHESLITGYIKLKIEGFLNGSQTGNLDFYLAAKPNTDPANPEYDFVLNDWTKADLTSLGTVDKVLFKISSSYVNESGDMVYEPAFCLDGIRLTK